MHIPAGTGLRLHREAGVHPVLRPVLQGHYLFARDGREASLTERPGVMDAGTAKTGYIMNQAYFVYDPSDGLYHRYQYGGIHQGMKGLLR